MTENNKEQKKQGEFICPICSSKMHQWKEAFYSTGSQLKRVNGQYVSWCSDGNKFVLSEVDLNFKAELKKV